MSAAEAIELEINRLIDEDDFYARLDGEAEDIEMRLKDGTKKSSLEWEIEALMDGVAMLKPKERPRFQAYVARKYPRTAKTMGWMAAAKIEA
ncbi:MAG: hypothetical protein LUQ09_02985 [Methanomassiliicoccales archaeon]|nr:hypothetical protein [Methanomassiliicoccales archaeon]